MKAANACIIQSKTNEIENNNDSLLWNMTVEEGD